MESPESRANDVALAVLEHELAVVRSAIAMVASGGAPSVLVGGLAFGEELVDAARQIAAAERVRIVPVWTADERGAAIRVEQIADG